MSYDYDVFLSYRRWREWPRWVKQVFSRLFEHWLGEEMDWEPRVFIDQRDVEQGSWWDQDLGVKLSRSRILVPLFSRKYFQSEWCKTELALMRKREDDCGLRTLKDRRVLIKPAILHDGEKFPIDATRLKGVDFKGCAYVRLAPESPKFEELERLIQDWVPSVAEAIAKAPPFDLSWEALSAREFMEVSMRRHAGSWNCWACR